MKNQVIERGSEPAGHRFWRAGLPGRLTRRAAATVFVAAALAAVACPASGDEITLKGSLRLPRGTTVVRLADIAELSGPLAERHADTIIAELADGTRVLEIAIQQIRRALDQAGVHWGKVQLNGRNVIVRSAGSAVSGPPLAMAPASITKMAGPSRHRRRPGTYDLAQDLIELPTLRGAIAGLIAQGLRVDPNELRLVFDERDAAFLNTRQEAFRFEIQPLGSLRSDRIELSVRAWSAGRVHESRSLTVRPTIKTEVVVLRHDIDRGDQLHEEDLSVEARWLGPRQSNTMSTLVQAVGQVAATKLRAGDVLRAKHVKRKLVIKRGDRVMVRCLVGGVVISLEAEARGQGAEGERIEFRKLGERDTFFATAAGPGAAIVDLSR